MQEETLGFVEFLMVLGFILIIMRLLGLTDLHWGLILLPFYWKIVFAISPIVFAVLLFIIIFPFVLMKESYNHIRRKFIQVKG